MRKYKYFLSFRPTFATKNTLIAKKNDTFRKSLRPSITY